MGISEVFKKNKLSWIYLFLVFILPFLAELTLLPFIIKNETYLQNASINFWILFYFLSCFSMAFALTHTTFIAILSGYFLGWNSIPFVIISYTIASMLGYFTASVIDKGRIMDSLLNLPKSKPISAALKKNEGKVIMFLRLSPVLPFGVMNLVLAFLTANLKTFVGAGLIGMLPRTLLFIWAGNEARNLRESLTHPQSMEYTKSLSILFLIISCFGLFYYIMKAFRKAEK